MKTVEAKNIERFRNRVFEHMLRTRGWKYRVFLRYLKIFKYAAFAPTRGEFLESYYVLMRYLDDIVDGDAPLPDGYPDESSYISEKIEFSQNPAGPKDEVDYLMLHCFELAERFNEGFQSETQDILNSLLFDANRRDKMIIFSEKILMHHFHLLDIRGTIQATLKIFKEDPEKYRLLEPLGVACRYQYDIEDIDTDLAAGYINISLEECKKLDISKADLKDASSIKIRRWLLQRAYDGLQLLEKHHQNLEQGQFSLLSRMTFRLVYESPARKTFNQIISESKAQGNNG
jgi:hypothetical protein